MLDNIIIMEIEANYACNFRLYIFFIYIREKDIEGDYDYNISKKNSLLQVKLHIPS